MQRKPFEELTFTDDFIFVHVMQNKDLCKELLERLLQIQIDHIEFPKIEKSIIPDYDSKSVRLDVYVKSSTRVYDIEMQTGNKKNLENRAQYYQALMDMDNLTKGENYNNLKETFVIFITTFDPFKLNLPIYTFTTVCEQNNSLKMQRRKIFFFNAKSYLQEQNLEIKNFLEYIITKRATDDFTHKIDRQVNKCKDSRKLQEVYMIEALAITDARYEGIEEGIAEGKFEQSRLAIKKFLTLGLTREEIATSLNLTLEEVNSIIATLD